MATLNHIIQNGRRKGYSVSLVGRFAFLASLATLLLFSVGCEKEENFSDIPEITYVSTTVKQSPDTTNACWQCTIKFEFKDGNGDIGDPSNSSKNCFFTQFDKVKGAFVEVIPANSQAGLSYTIPYMEPTGSNKQQKGTVSVKIDLFIKQQKADTVKYRFYIKDRALHSSDTLETEEIILKAPKN